MKKAIFVLISMVVMLGVFQIASAGVPTPGVGNQFVVKAGTTVVAMIADHLGMFKVIAFEDTLVTVIAIQEPWVMFSHPAFPHSCPVHGREPVDILKGVISFSYFEENPDVFKVE
ncbi:MAG TPA: hypothetical protein VMX17_14795 [Candidatus Glassbacteria bacterium]|nr:hypothetical protein [Candidatus Glassbacteria bacterium]